VSQITADSPANPLRELTPDAARRRGARLLALEVGAATTTTGLAAASLTAYLGSGTAYAMAFAFGTIGLAFATLLHLAQIRSPRLRLAFLGPVPVGAGLAGADVRHFVRAAPGRARAWALAVAATAGLAALVGGGSALFPSGHAVLRGGRYVEVSHGAVLRVLTREEFEERNMTMLRFSAAISTLLVAGLAVVLAGALAPERRDA
jgi:hypothetical protein